MWSSKTKPRSISHKLWLSHGANIVWRDATYASLSAIACNITGTTWNGPRFFGLRGGGKCPQVIENEPVESRAGIAAVDQLRRSSVSPPRTKVRR
jgi:Protein of unknown function (DUF2924)